MKKAVGSFLLMLCAVASFGQLKVATKLKNSTTTLKIYLSDGNDNPNFEDCGKVRAVTRIVPKTRAVAKAALDELAKGATEAEKQSNLSSIFDGVNATVFKSVNIKKGTAYVNLDEWVVANLGAATSSCGSLTFFVPIEKTLQQFPKVKRVFFAIEGDPEKFYDWMQIDGCPKELKNCDGTNFIK